MTLLEMHDRPGGLCTSWRRKGYPFDGSVAGLAGHPRDGRPLPVTGWKSGRNAVRALCRKDGARFAG